MNRKPKIRYIVFFFVIVLAVSLFGIVEYYFYEGPEISKSDCTSGAPWDMTVFASELNGFIRKFHDPAHLYDPTKLSGRFSIQENGATDLYGSCDLVFILWITGELENKTTDQSKGEWAELIHSFQDPESGLFSRNIVAGESVTHATAFATAALRLLGSAPITPHYWAEELFRSPDAINSWLDTFYWDQIWTGSHEIGKVAAFIDFHNGINIPETWQEWIISALDARIDPVTGFWKNGILDPVLKSPTTVDLGGAAHFWWIYRHLGKPIPYSEKVINGIIDLQKDSGLWGNRIFNGAFPQGIDFDAVNGLRYAYQSLPTEAQSKVKNDIVDSLETYACAVNRFLNQPGAIHQYYRSSHKLVGTLNAMAETNQFYQELTGNPVFRLPKHWRSTLDVITWQ